MGGDGEQLGEHVGFVQAGKLGQAGARGVLMWL